MSENNKSLSTLVQDELQWMNRLYEGGGEISETMEKELDLHQGKIPAKVDNYYYRRERLKAEIQILKDRENDIKRVRKSLEGGLIWLNNNLHNAMVELETDRLDGNDYYFKRSRGKAKVDILDEEKVPATFFKEEVIYTMQKDSIKDALDKGDEVPGARLVESYSLRNYPQKGK